MGLLWVIIITADEYHNSRRVQWRCGTQSMGSAHALPYEDAGQRFGWQQTFLAECWHCTGPSIMENIREKHIRSKQPILWSQVSSYTMLSLQLTFSPSYLYFPYSNSDQTFIPWSDTKTIMPPPHMIQCFYFNIVIRWLGCSRRPEKD